MNLAEQIKETNWLKISFFYGIILLGTYLARKLPNLLNLILEQITDIPFSFNYNHGFVTLIIALLFYKFGGVKQEITLFGNNKIKSLLFPICSLVTQYMEYITIKELTNIYGLLCFVHLHLFTI